MIKIKEYIFNENEILHTGGTGWTERKQIEVITKNNELYYIDDVTFRDIEWNYENNISESLSYDLAKARIEELEEENKTLKELNVCVGCDNNPDYKTRIKELEEENERLKAKLELEEDNRHYLNNKIGKAIEYIKTNTYSVYDKKTTIYEDVVLVDKLLNILKGGEE